MIYLSSIIKLNEEFVSERINAKHLHLTSFLLTYLKYKIKALIMTTIF